MTSPADIPRRSRWEALRRHGALRRPHSVEQAAAELMSRLALTVEMRGRVLETLRLAASSPVRTLAGLPGLWLGQIALMFPLVVVGLIVPWPLTVVILIPLAVIAATIRAAALDNAKIHRVSLAESEISHRLAEQIALGQTLSQSMARLSGVFTAGQVAVVRAGEESGDLASALACLSREAEVRRSGKVMTFHRVYPVVALFVLSFLSVGIGITIYPKLTQIYDQLGAEIPTLTQLVFSTLSLHPEGWQSVAAFFALIAGLCLIIDHIARLQMGRLTSAVLCAIVLLKLVGPWLSGSFTPIWFSALARDYADLFVPILLIVVAFLVPTLSDLMRSGFRRAVNAAAWLAPPLRRRRGALERAAFLESLGLLFARRVPAGDALRMAAPTLAPIGHAISARHAAAAVERGEALVDTLCRLRLLRPREEALMRLAERAGDLPAECRRLAADLADEARLRLAQRERMMRPLGVLVVGVLGFFVLTALYVPLFSLGVSIVPLGGR